MGTLYTTRSGATAHPEDTVLQFVTDMLKAGGVLNLSSADHFKVVQRAAGVNRSVDVKVGRAIVKGSSGNAYVIRHESSSTNLPLAANSSGANRIDAIVLYINLAASPSADGSGVATLMAVTGTGTVALDDSAVQTAVGASNPYIRLANVTVANSAATITDSNIADVRNRFRLIQQTHFGTIVDPGTGNIPIDVSVNNVIKVQPTANSRNLVLSGDSIGDSFTVKIKQPASGGPYSVNWWANIDWFGGTPSLSQLASRVDAFLFNKRDDGKYDGYVIGQDQIET